VRNHSSRFHLLATLSLKIPLCCAVLAFREQKFFSHRGSLVVSKKTRKQSAESLFEW
jgi:hypothetical protein